MSMRPGDDIGLSDPHAAARLLTEPADGPAQAVLVLVHGRGADAEGMMELGRVFAHEELQLVAPQASDFTWYPTSFLAPFEQNEPYLSSALALLDRVTADLVHAGIPYHRIGLLGFSQGACLTLEFAARNPRRYGAVIGFSGGLIGPPGTEWALQGSMEGTPVFLGCSDRDPHIPLQRLEDSARHFGLLGARVDLRVYPEMPHTIIADEIRAAETLIIGMLSAHHRGEVLPPGAFPDHSV